MGVEVIQEVVPDWEGPESGLLWPYLLILIGLVDENGQPTFFDPEEDIPVFPFYF